MIANSPGVRAAGTRVPNGYSEVVSPAATWIARPGCVDAVAAGGLDFLLLGPARRHGGAGGGRGPIMSIQLAGIPVIAKRPVHGGILGPLLGSLYVGPGRLIDQVSAAERLRQCGVVTPEVLAIGWRRVSGPFQAHGIATRRISGAVSFFQALRAELDDGRRRVILARCADAIRLMHEAGFVHADLNVTNLVLEKVDGDLRVQVVDLERGRFRHPVGFVGRARNLARLLRSHEKWMAKDHPLSGREEIRFLHRYSRADRTSLRRLRIVLQIYRKCLFPRRLAWRVFGRRSTRATE